MKSRYALTLIVWTAASLLASCTGDKPKGTAPQPIKGKVVALDAAKATVTLDHEEIPGVMKAMRMEFPVNDPKVIEGLQPGDLVQGQLNVESGRYVITRLEKR